MSLKYKKSKFTIILYAIKYIKLPIFSTNICEKWVDIDSKKIIFHLKCIFKIPLLQNTQLSKMKKMIN